MSLCLKDGDYSAALVVDNKDIHCSEDFGCCLVAVLDYKKPNLPTLTDFEQADVLSLTHSHWNGEHVIYWLAPLTNRELKRALITVGKIELGHKMNAFHLEAIRSHGFWANIFTGLIMQKEHEANSR